jgi:hypothetical protein
MGEPRLWTPILRQKCKPAAGLLVSKQASESLSDHQRVKLRLKGSPIDYSGRFKFIAYDFFHRSLPS